MINVLPNYTLEPRQATVVIQSSVITSKKIQVAVSQPKYDFEIGSTDNTFASTGGTKSVSVKSSGQVIASSKDSWLTCNVSGGTMTFTASANETGVERTTTVTVTTEHYSATNKALYKEIQFKQLAK
jgi:hypothetical protein